MTERDFIDEALPTSGHSAMYVMHKFFARKQEDVIREYIKTFSKNGEVILDPFCGSGVMVGEALKLGRVAIGVDINPVAIFITRNTIKHADINKIIKEYKGIKKDVATHISKLYMTSCRVCHKEIPAICFTWDNKTLVDVRYECHQHGRLISTISKDDLLLQQRIEDGELREFFDDNGRCIFWYPTEKLYYSNGTPFLKKERFDSVDEIFTSRNLIALAKLNDRIEQIDEDDLKEAFKFAFSSMTHLASKMTPVRPSRPFSSAWVQQSYWYCPNNMESNVWKLFERAVIGHQGLTKAKSNLSEVFKAKKEASSFNQLLKGKKYDYLLLQSSVEHALEGIKENSIDFVICDPPYGHSIQYGELLYMWGCWLQIMDNFDEIAKGEIIKNSRQKKDYVEYEQMMKIAFMKIYHVLKPEGYCIVTFHNPSLKYRNILFRSVLLSGFEFEKIVYQPPPRPSVKSLLQPFGSQRGDYFFRFKKPKLKTKKSYKTIEADKVEELIVDITKKIITERGEPTYYTDIQNFLDPILYEKLKKSDLLMDFDPESVEKILRKHIGKVFLLVDIGMRRTGNKKLQGKGWWLIEQKNNVEIIR